MNSGSQPDLQDIIIRPAGVWDSRAPFHTYLKFHRARLRIYGTLVLSTQKLRIEAQEVAAEPLTRAFFHLKKGGFVSNKAWGYYSRSRSRPVDGQNSPLTFGGLFVDLGEAFWWVTEASIVACASMFEAYVQCWSLNWLLARLEHGDRLTRIEASLAARLSPLNTRGVAPQLPDILNALPFVKDGLRGVPHMRTDPDTGLEVETPVTETLNALNTIMFWRSYRNLLVHGSGMVSWRFAERHRHFVDDLRTVLPDVPPLVVGERIQLRDHSFRAMSTSHYVAALWLNDQLHDLAGARRGHPLAPGPIPEVAIPVPEDAAPMLVEGDHEPSYRWTVDPVFRGAVRDKIAASTRRPNPGLQPTAGAAGVEPSSTSSGARRG